MLAPIGCAPGENILDHFAKLLRVVHFRVVAASAQAEGGVAVVGMIGVAESDDRDSRQFRAALEGGENIMACHIFQA